jgi:hypothetical protein
VNWNGNELYNIPVLLVFEGRLKMTLVKRRVGCAGLAESLDCVIVVDEELYCVPSHFRLDP